MPGLINPDGTLVHPGGAATASAFPPSGGGKINSKAEALQRIEELQRIRADSGSRAAARLANLNADSLLSRVPPVMRRGMPVEADGTPTSGSAEEEELDEDDEMVMLSPIPAYPPSATAAGSVGSVGREGYIPSGAESESSGVACRSSHAPEFHRRYEWELVFRAEQSWGDASRWKWWLSLRR